MTPLITFIGRHNSGKTTLVRAVVGRLRAKGYNVAVVKSTKDRDPEVDRPGSDSALYRADGVLGVALVGPEKLLLWEDARGEPLRHIAFRLFPEADLVIGEGFKHDAEVPKIEVARAAISRDLFRNSIPGVVAVVADFPVPWPTAFAPNQVEEIASFIVEQTPSPWEARGDVVELFVNGRHIPLNHYVRNSLRGVLVGFVNALKGAEGGKEIEIRIRKQEPMSS